MILFSVLFSSFFLVNSQIVVENELSPSKINDVKSESFLDEKQQEYETIVEKNIAAKAVDLFPDEPLQIIKPDSNHKNLVIIEENLKFLYAIKEPVKIISVVGKYHSGKSFLMNQLMSKSNGFGIGSKVTPETMGVWMWGKPIKNDLNEWILLFDTEGFAANNISETYDAKIFAVATLISTQLLYNSVKIIDQSDIDYLELLSRRTQLFALKAQITRNSDWTNEFSNHLLLFPSLIWVLQDFVQETEGKNCNDWLMEILSSHTREAESYSISLKNVFPHIDCQTLFIPSAKKKILTDLSRATENDLLQDYKTDRDILVRKILSDKAHKNLLTGKEIVWLLRLLVNAANTGSLSDIPNRWDAFLEKLKQSSIDDCFSFYEAHMKIFLQKDRKDKIHAVNETLLERWHIDGLKKASNLLSHLLQGLNEYREASQKKLVDKIETFYTLSKSQNSKNIQHKLLQYLNQYSIEIRSEFDQLNYPVLTVQIDSVAGNLTNFYQTLLVAQMSDLVVAQNLVSYLENLKKTVQDASNSAKLENNKHLESMFDKTIDQVITKEFADISINFKKPALKINFENTLNEVNKKVISMFEELVSIFKEEKVYSLKVYKLKNDINEKCKKLREKNELAVQQFLMSEVEHGLKQLSDLTLPDKLKFPISFEQMDNILRSKALEVKKIWMEDVSQYKDFHCYQTASNFFDQQCNVLAGSRRKQNLSAFKVEVEEALKTAKTSILLTSSKYYTWYAFKKFSRTICLIQLNYGKARNWPSQLKNEVIESFLNEDKDMKRELDARIGFLSTLIGFFQWLYTIFFDWSQY